MDHKPTLLSFSPSPIQTDYECLKLSYCSATNEGNLGKIHG